ncbi:hypothetical protein D3C81_1438210 [compost metagenome]
MAVCTCNHFNDGAFRTTASVGAYDACLDPVAVQDFLHFFFRQKDIGTGVVRNQEAEAVSVAADATFNKIGRMGKLIIAGAIWFDLSIALHRVQATHQAVHLIRFYTESSSKCGSVVRTGGRT